jgi:uncharacterized membrane protein
MLSGKAIHTAPYNSSGKSHVRSCCYRLSVRSESRGGPSASVRFAYLIEFSDAVIAVKTDAGPVKLNQLVNMTAAGAASGSFWGLLIGVLFLNPLIGVALGAASGALSGALTDYGINDAFMKELAANLKPGDAALFVLIQNMTADKVLKEIQGAGGTVLKTSLDDAKESALREALAKAGTTQPGPSAVNAS